MRNIIALIATLTLSSASTMSIIACNSSIIETGTNNVFNWNKIPGGTTAEQFFNFLLKNPNHTIGNDLYTKVNNYVNLSILKNDPKYSSDYQAALIVANSEKDNMINSIKAKFGRNWEKEWKKFLKTPIADGGGGGTVDTYIDSILQKKATDIINRSYVTQNYQDYKYYNLNEISIWLADIWNQVSPNSQSKKYSSVKEYADPTKGGAYAKNVWIVANANNTKPSADFNELNDEITKKHKDNWTGIRIKNPVAKTVDNKEGSAHEIDTYKSIDGLLSDNQAKIAKVMLRNQQPIWTRQIVIPFNDTGTKPLQEKITEQQFSQNQNKIEKIIKGIQKNGFDNTFYIETKGAVVNGDITKSGDLGLLNIDGAKDTKTPFYYYLYRFVTSNQGVGQQVASNVQPYSLTEFSGDNLTKLLPYIDRTNDRSNINNTNQFNDLVFMQDKTFNNSELPDPVNNNGAGVGIFIDTTGIHFIQTPGITYQPQIENNSTFKLIKKFNEEKTTKTKLMWSDCAPLVNRPGGLASTPYLSYLQTVFLLQRNTSASSLSFDLNDAISKFTAAGDVRSPNWWDYNLFFNRNVDLIHWNLQDITGSQPVGNDKVIQGFVERMKNWFTATLQNRWNNKQGIYTNQAFLREVAATNKIWNGYTAAPVARLDLNIVQHLNNIGRETLWWYDTSIIRN